MATILAQEGFSTIEELAYVPVSELASIEEFDEEMVKELRNRARDVLLTQAIASEESMESTMPADDLLALTGMNPDLALELARRGVRTREQLAEQAVDDLADIEGLDEQGAGALIMKAREHWFQAGSRPRVRMADVTVSQFAEVLKVPIDRLLVQLEQAGITVSGADAVISDEAKLELLTHLRRSHGSGDDTASPRKITLKRKTQTELKMASTQGRARTVNVEVRVKRTYVKRDVLEEQNRAQQEQADLKRKEIEAAQQVEAEKAESERREQERLDQENRRRLEEEQNRTQGRGRSASRAGTARARGWRARDGRDAAVREAPRRGAGAGPGRAACTRGTAARRAARRGAPARAAPRRPRVMAGRNCMSPATSARASRRRRCACAAVRRRPTASRSTASKCPPRRRSAKCRSARRSRLPSWPTAWPSRPTKSSRR